jgi:transcriptional regulator with XRE-family HTH domain
VKKLSQAAFAELFHLARPSVGAYEEGRSEPKIDTLVQISKHFGLSIDLLLTKELTINDLYGFDIFKRGYNNQETPLKKVAAAKPAEPALVLVPASRTSEYLVHYQDQAFLQQLPTFQLPGKGERTTRAFEVSGTDMQFHPKVHPGDLLVGVAVDLMDPSQVQPGRLYVVVTPGNLLARRLVNLAPNGGFGFQAQYPEHSGMHLQREDVGELWEVMGMYSTVLEPPAPVEERLAQLEQTVQQLSLRVKNLKK